MTYNVFSGTLNPTQSIPSVFQPPPVPEVGDMHTDHYWLDGLPVTNHQCQSTEGNTKH